MSEALVAEFLERRYYDTHLMAPLRVLDERYARCLELLRGPMPDGIRWTTPGGGPALWLEVPPAVSPDRLGARVKTRGVPEILERAMKRVADALREELS